MARSLEAARKRFGGRTGKVKMDCHGDARCVAAVDGTPADARKVIYVIAGPHAVVVQRGEERFERLVDVGADGTVVVWIPAAGAAVAERDREREPGTGTTRVEKESGGTSPSWFFCRGRGDRRDWRGDGVQWARCFEEARSIFRGCLWGWGDGGAAARLRAAGAGGKERAAPHESLAGATGVLAAATAAVGIFAVRWKSGASARLTVRTQRSAALAGFEIVTFSSRVDRRPFIRNCARTGTADRGGSGRRAGPVRVRGYRRWRG